MQKAEACTFQSPSGQVNWQAGDNRPVMSLSQRKCERTLSKPLDNAIVLFRENAGGRFERICKQLYGASQAHGLIHLR